VFQRPERIYAPTSSAMPARISQVFRKASPPRRRLPKTKPIGLIESRYKRRFV